MKFLLTTNDSLLLNWLHTVRHDNLVPVGDDGDGGGV